LTRWSRAFGRTFDGRYLAVSNIGGKQEGDYYEKAANESQLFFIVVRLESGLACSSR
jgi:hypothetical protein